MKTPTQKEVWELQRDYGGAWVRELWRRYPRLFPRGTWRKGEDPEAKAYWRTTNWRRVYARGR